MIDQILLKAAGILMSPESVRWNSFASVGIDDPYHSWYYAGEQQYIIHDAMMDTYFFVKAGSPAKAYCFYMTRVGSAVKAGQVWKEEE